MKTKNRINDYEKTTRQDLETEFEIFKILDVRLDLEEYFMRADNDEQLGPGEWGD